MSEEEFDELINIMSENNLTQHGADTLFGEIVDREIERKRLNNIINSMNDYLVRNIANGSLDFMYRQGFKDSYERLQELKERS